MTLSTTDHLFRICYWLSGGIHTGIGKASRYRCANANAGSMTVPASQQRARFHPLGYGILLQILHAQPVRDNADPCCSRMIL
jgi:hypothetical protein